MNAREEDRRAPGLLPQVLKIVKAQGGGGALTVRVFGEQAIGCEI